MITTALLALTLSASGITVVDDVGRVVTLAAPPRRIVSTTPSGTALLFALGAGDRVVGVTTFCTYPEAAKALAKIGDFSTLDYESIVALAPDLVVATWLEQRRAVERLEALGFEVLVLYPTTIDGMLESLLSLGKAIGREEAARELRASLRERLGALDARVKAIPESRRPRVFVELTRSPLYTAGPGSTVDEAVRRAGGINVAAAVGKPFAVIARESVIESDPEIVLLGMEDGVSGEGLRAVAAEPGFASLSAVKSGRVHRVDPGILFQPNHRLVDGIERLFQLFHGLPQRLAEPAVAAPPISTP